MPEAGELSRMDLISNGELARGPVTMLYLCEIFLLLSPITYNVMRLLAYAHQATGHTFTLCDTVPANFFKAATVFGHHG